MNPNDRVLSKESSMQRNACCGCGATSCLVPVFTDGGEILYLCQEDKKRHDRTIATADRITLMMFQAETEMQMRNQAGAA
jgi:hypothetical protein